MTRTLKLIVMMGGLAATSTIAMIGVVMHLIQGVSSGANALDEAKTRQAVSAMVAGLIDQATGLMTDNAKWDDAVDHSYGEANQQWLFDTWGYSSADQNYDASFVIDEAGKTVAAFAKGEIAETTVDAYLGPAFKALAATLPQDGKTFAVAAAIQQTAKGFAVVSVAPILPYTEGKVIPGSRPRLLAFAKTLTPEVVAGLGERLIVKNLQIVPALDGEPSHVPIAANGAAPAGYFVWTPDRPGDVARSSIQGPAILVLAGMFACMVLFVVMSSRLSMRLEGSERQAWLVAHRDVLTGLPNRQAVMEILSAKLAAQRESASGNIVVMLADLDGFKEVNDTYGHHIGDDLIRALAAGFQVIAEGFDATLSRLGGDEFALILAGENAEQRAAGFADAALRFLAQPFNLDGRIARVGMSVGIAAAGSQAVDAAELMRRADVAMYAAKEHGKNRTRVYETAMDIERDGRIVMAERLTQALADGRIEVFYQPVFDARSRTITGVEALARWRQADGNSVPPDRFIRVAEEFGLIDRLGNQVLAIACQTAAAWPAIRLSVNISPAQFRNPDFVDTVLKIVHASGLARDRLELEVTEGYLIEHQDRAKPILEKLRAHGIHVALDDFGSGYSSIGYLRQYHFDRLKIDKSLIRGMMTDASARSIIQATAVLAQSMDMAVTAEGVEAEEEASLLRLAGCDSLQGFHLARPQPAEAITALLAAPQEEAAVA